LNEIVAAGRRGAGAFRTEASQEAGKVTRIDGAVSVEVEAQAGAARTNQRRHASEQRVEVVCVDHLIPVEIQGTLSASGI
jgi:hypothetical protein